MLDVPRRPPHTPAMLPVTRFPLIGRHEEFAALSAALDAGKRGRGSVHVISGEGGVGKTRLAEAVAERARELGFATVTGRAFQVETGIPYALFADAFVPVLRDMPPAALQTLSRGAATELSLLFPTLRAEGPAPRAGSADELKPRLLDSFTQLLFRMAQRQPALVVLENLHWADPSSIDLFHFVARSAPAHPLVLVATCNDAQREGNRGLRAAEQSLGSLGVLHRHALPPLTAGETAELVQAVFGEPREAIGDFADRVHARARGNPFFIEETLKALVRAGRLVRAGERWTGWLTEQLGLPDSIRDALSSRYERLSTAAQQVALAAAVVGAQVPHALLRRLVPLDEAALLGAVDELRRDRVLEELDAAGAPAYVFTHPMLQEMLYAEIGRARVRLRHAEIADALEHMYGDSALAHADELAVHFRRAESEAQAPRAIRYLTLAGENALGRGANREAIESLGAALALAQRDGDTPALEQLLDLLGRARHRLGDYAGAVELWGRAVTLCEARGDCRRVAQIERRLGVAALRVGDFARALAHQARGLDAAVLAKDDVAEAGLHLARSSVMMEVGKGAEAEREGRLALAIAERLADARLLARVHQALHALAVWRGPRTAAAEHGAQALRFAAEANDGNTAWQAEWTMAFQAGLTGDSTGTRQHIAEALRMAEDQRSPVQRLWTAEVAIEYRSAIGEWDEALALADRTIDEARAFGQRMLLPRLLVWSALVHCGRGNLDEAKTRIDEAWRLSGADRAGEGEPVNVHTVVPAHVGLASYHLYRRDYRAALDIAERGLAIADGTGYTVWAVHRLLPLVAEASLWLRDWERSELYGNRLLAAAEQLGHPLARAWSDGCFALARWLKGDVAGAILQLQQAADALDAIPFTEHAARLRRQLAFAYTDSGDTTSASAELRRIHDVFARLGATLALADVREKLRELGERPPPRVPPAGSGVGALTAREAEIARLIAARKSNKEAGAVLGISARTVGTHLSNIYTKLGVDSRGALADLVREQGI